MSNIQTLSFGSGVLWATPAGVNSTPIEFGTLQDVSVDFSFSEKELFGTKQFAVAIARGKAKIKGKAQTAEIKAALAASLFFNTTPTTGQDLINNTEGGTIPATPFQITVANGATFSANLGVFFVATGLELTRVASAPTTGQYSVSAAGVYLFAAADTGKAVLISYKYTNATTGKKILITSQAMGTAPTFGIDLMGGANPNVPGSQWSLTLFACISTSFKLQTKTEDWVTPDFDFTAMANAADQVGTLNTAG